MLLKQLIDNANPLAYWTGERYAVGNVFDEYSNHTLINTNATLGVAGGASTSLSSRAININGGYLRISDATFLNSKLVSRDVSIGFGFRVYNRTKDNPVTGFKPIISKWNPEQSFMIGFENGIIVAKVQTTGGVVGLEFDYPDIIYNDRWNYVQFMIESDKFTLWVNGCPVSVTNGDAIVTTSASFFQIGGDSTEIMDKDVYVADVSITDAMNEGFQRMLYSSPRTTRECVLNLNPTHYYNLLDAVTPDSPHVNLGSAGGYGYLTYTGAAPTKIKANIYTDEDTINMPEGCKLSIDTMPTPNLISGFSMLVRGEPSTSGMDSNNNPLHQHRIFDFRNNLSDNNGRFFLSYNYYSPGTREFWGWVGYDAAGSEITNTPASSNVAEPHFSYGTKLFTFKSGDYRFDNTTYSQINDVNVHTDTIGYSLPLAVNHVDLWANIAVDNVSLSYIALFDYTLPEGCSMVIDPPKFKMIADYFLTKYPSELVWLLYGIGGPFASDDGQSAGNTPLHTTSGYSYVSGLYDPGHNRQNDFPRTISLPNTSAYIGGQTRSNNINFNDPNGMTIYAFVWNRNSDTRYRWIYNTSGIDFEIWMNSRDGVYSEGDVEVMYDKDVSNSHLSTTTRNFIDNGFHLFAVTRDGLNLSIWADGEVVASRILATTPPYHMVNTTLRMHGGPLYVNDWGAFTTPFDATEMALLTYGFQDYISGQCTLNGVELPSVLLATDSHTGRVMKTEATDNDGNFKFFLPKSLDGETVTILALAQDDNATNNVVAHGPYNLQTDYRKYSYELTAQDYDDMVLDFEPYAYYKMDETSGTTIVDSSGNGRDGTAVGGVTLNQSGPASFMKAIAFDGSDDHIDLPDGYSDLSNGFTLEGWVKYDSFSQNWSRVFEAATGAAGANSIFFAHGATGSHMHLIVRDGSSDIGAVNYNNGWVINTWQHVVCRISPDGAYSLWINGAKVAEATSQNLPNVITRTLNYFGRSTHSFDGYFLGSMSNMATYDYPLPDEEIERHSARGFEIPVQTMKSLIIHDNPFAYWTFDRLDQFVNQTDEPVVLTQNGSFTIVKNALGINTGVVGNNYLTTDDVAIDDNGDGWTIEFSFKTGSTQVLAILLAEWDTSGGNVGTFKVQLNNSNLLSVHLNDDATQMVSTTTYNDDVWHHVVISNDGNGTTSLYFDGTVEDTISTSITYGTNDFSIGNSADGDASTATEAATYLDDVAIYKYGLNATRITEHYNQFVKKKVYQ